MSSWKAGIWDGFIRLYDYKTKKFPKGLVPDLIDWAQSQEYRIEIKGEGFKHFRDVIPFDPDSYDLPFPPYDYQVDAVKRLLTKKRQLILSPTASGKSLIAYMTCRALDEHKILIIVPTVSLVTQLASDFEDYSKNSSWSQEESVHKIFSGKEKYTNKPITISTWQSVFSLPAEHFEQFDAVICDEVHLATGASISKIMEKCTNAKIRLGLTGTLTDCKTNEMVLVGHFGPVFRMITTAELMAQGKVSDLMIRAIILKHKGKLPAMQYADEMDYLVRHQARNEFITRLVKDLKGNTLVLFQYVEKHGRVLEKMFKEHTGKEVHFVYGGTDADTRENVRKITEQRDGVIILASTQVFSTGVSIKKLHNVVFASPTKSKIRILQSIGRTLRLHDSKAVATLYDIGDDLRSGKKALNHTLKHFTERLKTYMAEQFTVKTLELEI